MRSDQQSKGLRPEARSTPDYVQYRKSAESVELKASVAYARVSCFASLNSLRLPPVAHSVACTPYVNATLYTSSSNFEVTIRLWHVSKIGDVVRVKRVVPVECVNLGFNGQLNPCSGSKYHQRLVLFSTKVTELAAANYCLSNGKLTTLAAELSEI